MRYVLLPLLIFWMLPAQMAAQEVESRHRTVALHPGVAYARLPDAEFEVVRSLAGQDLFAEVGAHDDRADFVAFLSHRIGSGPAVTRSWVTLGTTLDRSDPVLYLGGSLGISRGLLSVGMSTTLVAEGVDATSDQVFRGTGERTLYAGLDRGRAWGLFLALSFGLIQ